MHPNACNTTPSAVGIEFWNEPSPGVVDNSKSHNVYAGKEVLLCSACTAASPSATSVLGLKLLVHEALSY